MLGRLLLLGFLFVALPLAAVTRDNDDSCDISNLPAATLLLPYFEVDLDTRSGGLTTRFTITNVTSAERIAHVTLWTDRAYPVIGFNIYLTGYDMQIIDLYDVISRGIVAPPSGTGTAPRPRGRYSDPNPQLDGASCVSLPGALPPEYVARMRDAFTTGRVDRGACAEVGSQHANAVGYATIDVVGSCSTAGVQEREYWTRDLRYDNVLVGDYEIDHPTAGVAQGGPLVHIRAIPEGGTPELRRAAPVTFEAGFQRTFYGRHQPADAPRLDGRQPLPAQFAPRWIQGGPSQFRTSLKVWREGAVRADAPCAAFEANDDLAVADIVRFDENENAVGTVPRTTQIVVPPARSRLDATSSTSVTDAAVYPQLTNGATAGWFALNLDTARDDGEVTQGWVISSMSALGVFTSDTEAAAFGNGCSPEVGVSEVTSGIARIAPAPNVNRGARVGQASTNNDDSCDIALLPAATLLVPFFAVDVEPTRAETTLLSITNAGPEEQIARVTLWTDYAFPVLTFNVFLTGYDVQSIDLYDVIARGLIAPANGTGTAVSPRGRWSVRNDELARGGCEQLPATLGAEWIAWMRRAFQEGAVPDFGLRERCDDVGLEHLYASGYATIDVVRNCAATGPSEPSYWSRDLAFDNVLIGDYQIVRSAHAAAEGGPMVHIRAVPEGGARDAAALPRTFYSRFQSAAAPRRDARQPLPSTFAARWSTAGAETLLDIWREGATRGDASCSELGGNFTPSVDFVRFDDQENAVADDRICRDPICRPLQYALPATSRTNVRDTTIYPFLVNGATDGWLYLNLDRAGDAIAAQAWVVATRITFGQRAVRRDAAALGNGCSAPVPRSEVAGGTAVIGPAPNRNP